MPREFIVSDTHFRHENIIKFESKVRAFHNIKMHDEELIKRWNETVAPEDNVIHVGDVCFKSGTQLGEVLPLLNGNKVLLRGNHDTAPIREYLKYFMDVKATMEVNFLEGRAIISHYPVHPSSFDFRYVCNIHGHLHSNLVMRPDGHPDTRYINVSCEHTGLRPLAWEELELRVRQGQDIYKAHLRNTAQSE